MRCNIQKSQPTPHALRRVSRVPHQMPKNRYVEPGVLLYVAGNLLVSLDLRAFPPTRSYVAGGAPSAAARVRSGEQRERALGMG